jgi:hypothetical protein
MGAEQRGADHDAVWVAAANALGTGALLMAATPAAALTPSSTVAHSVGTSFSSSTPAWAAVLAGRQCIRSHVAHNSMYAAAAAAAATAATAATAAHLWLRFCAGCCPAHSPSLPQGVPLPPLPAALDSLLQPWLRLPDPPAAAAAAAVQVAVPPTPLCCRRGCPCPRCLPPLRPYYSHCCGCCCCK